MDTSASGLKELMLWCSQALQRAGINQGEIRNATFPHIEQEAWDERLQGIRSPSENFARVVYAEVHRRTGFTYPGL